MKRYKKGPFLNSKLEGERVDQQIKDIQIKVADKHLPILSLSGGNQQKVVIGKGLLTEPKILLMDEPSRGIDIGAKTEVFEIINKYAQQGLSIIVISSELQEIVAISDRILVLSNGLKTGEFMGMRSSRIHWCWLLTRAIIKMRKRRVKLWQRKILHRIIK